MRKRTSRTWIAALVLTILAGISCVASEAATSHTLSTMMAFNCHDPLNETLLATAHADGFTWERTDLLWAVVQHDPSHPDAYDWSKFDAYVAAAKKHDIKLHFGLQYGNALLYSGDMTSKAEQDAYVKFAYAAAAHFKGDGCEFEVWNEPENKWSSGTSAQFGPFNPTVYGQLCNRAIDAIHQADPSARVSTGGLGSFNYAFADPMLAAGAAAHADAIAVHQYWIGTPGKGDGNDNPENAIAYKSGWDSTIAKYAHDTNSDWMTECGPWINDSFIKNDQNRYATVIVRQILCDWMAGFDFQCIYDATDGPQGLFLTDDAGHLRRANSAIQYLTTITHGRAISSFKAPRLDAPGTADNGTAKPNGVWSITLTGSPKTEIVWVPVGTAQVGAPWANAVCRDMFGKPLTVTNGWVMMSEDSGVYYFSRASH